MANGGLTSKLYGDYLITLPRCWKRRSTEWDMLQWLPFSFSKIYRPLCIRNQEDKVYSYDGFKEHFRECQGAQKLWELSNKGFNVSGVSTRLEGGEPFVKLHGNVKIPQ